MSVSSVTISKCHYCDNPDLVGNSVVNSRCKTALQHVQLFTMTSWWSQNLCLQHVQLITTSTWWCKIDVLQRPARSERSLCPDHRDELGWISTWLKSVELGWPTRKYQKGQLG